MQLPPVAQLTVPHREWQSQPNSRSEELTPGALGAGTGQHTGNGSSPAGFQGAEHPEASAAEPSQYAPVPSPPCGGWSLGLQSTDEALLPAFRPYTSDFGFFLDWNRLMHFFEPCTSVTRDSSAVLNAMYMWGAHLKLDTEREHYFRHRALQCVSAELTPTLLLHTVQAEVLLSYFFFRVGRLPEARIHAATAVGLAIEGGLHRTRSLYRPVDIAENVLRSHGPVDAVGEGELINGFWAVFMLQKNLSVATQPSHPVLCVFEASGMPVDTPWPLELDDYRQGFLAPNIRGDLTVRNYLSGVASQGPWSLIAAQVKASILFHQAVHLEERWKHSREANAQWWTSFSITNSLIDALRHELLNFTQLPDRSCSRMVMLTRCMLNAATIKLNHLFCGHPPSRTRCVAAARDAFKVRCMERLGYLNPVVATSWRMAYSVLDEELQRIQSPEEAGSESSPELVREIQTSLQDGLDLHRSCVGTSLLLRCDNPVHGTQWLLPATPFLPIFEHVSVVSEKSGLATN
ncbi:hypothetical protein C8R47DRAFT_1108699 [Mycena vitilis]|nr:hypothetical protein C8R47DRAFT_1108699 [Mycena vitilis]